MSRDLIDRQTVIDALEHVISHGAKSSVGEYHVLTAEGVKEYVLSLPSAEPEIAENLYLCKCYITDKDGLQHEVIHTGDIRRVTGWEI